MVFGLRAVLEARIVVSARERHVAQSVVSAEVVAAVAAAVAPEVTLAGRLCIISSSFIRTP